MTARAYVKPNADDRRAAQSAPIRPTTAAREAARKEFRCKGRQPRITPCAARDDQDRCRTAKKMVSSIDRRDKHSHQQKKNRRAAILEQCLHRHLRLVAERDGCRLNRRGEQESARDEAEVPQGTRNMAQLKRTPADRPPEGRAEARANLRGQVPEQKKKQQRLMHDGEQPRIRAGDARSWAGLIPNAANTASQ